MTQILHLTNVANLSEIVRAGGLWSPNRMPPTVTPSTIAHSDIQQRRATFQVPAGPGGVLHDYVPFYFGERSPMLYANHTGYVPSNAAGQRPLVYLVSTVDAVVATASRWVFTDGHAVIRITRFFESLADLPGAVDWSVVHAKQWADTREDPDRKRRKQAEFLVHEFFPLDLVEEIAVMDDTMRTQVEQIVAPIGRALRVSTRREWYYE